MRVIPVVGIMLAGKDRITPACAGNTLTLRKSISRMLGSPPHVRVILFKKFKASSVERITPACAGNTDMF